MTLEKVRCMNSCGWGRSLAASIAAATISLVAAVAPSYAQTADAYTSSPSVKARVTGADQSIRPFHIKIPQEALTDLRRRIAATQWPERETVSDATQGVQLATMRKLAHYWESNYDWRKVEARLNALPQFVTTIDGLDIHFIHVRSKNANALPVIVTHGWPGSIIEHIKIIGPLTDPTAYGGKAEDSFDVVIPSLPGYGFSGKPTATGWDPIRIARAWTVLMKRLGYTRYVAQGGDWGNAVTPVGRCWPATSALSYCFGSALECSLEDPPRGRGPASQRPASSRPVCWRLVSGQFCSYPGLCGRAC